jgi:hypothetical protein
MIDIVIAEDQEKCIRRSKELGYKELLFAKKSKPGIYKIITNNTEKTLSQFDSDTMLKSDIFFDIESPYNRDGIHQRHSGLNHIICRQMNKTSKIVCFSLNTILKGSVQDRIRILGKIKQNIKLLRKYKVGVIIASLATSADEMRSFSDIASLFKCIGMRDSEIKKSSYILKRL